MYFFAGVIRYLVIHRDEVIKVILLSTYFIMHFFPVKLLIGEAYRERGSL